MDSIIVTIRTCNNCHKILDLEDAAATVCPHCDHPDIADTTQPLTDLIDKYLAAHAVAHRAGSIEIACPSCKEAVMISDLDTCICDAICCCECTTHTEDANFCPACIKKYQEEAAVATDAKP